MLINIRLALCYGRVKRLHLYFVILMKKTNDTYMRPCGSMFVAHIGIEIFKERLTLDDVIAKDELT